MANEHKNDIIERYLLGQLDEREIVQFQYDLIRDPELQAELAEQKMIMKTLWTPKAKAVVPPKRYKIVRLAFGIILISVSLYFLLLPTKVKTPKTEPVLEETFTKPTISKTIQPEEKPKPTKQPEQAGERKVEKKRPPSSSKTASPGKKEKEEKIIAANFLPNPEWENYIGSSLRSNGVRFVLEEPEVQYESNQLFFTINGQIETQTKAMDKHFKMHFFSNKKEDFHQFTPLQSWDIIPRENSTNGMGFNLKKPLNITPGLYYYVIENADSGIWYAVGKITIND